jgi:hypothetical protein
VTKQHVGDRNKRFEQRWHGTVSRQHTDLERVRLLVERLRPEAICDECIADKLELPLSDDAFCQSGELAGTLGFERKIGNCAICRVAKKVIRRKVHLIAD